MATADELKKDGSAVKPGAVRPNAAAKGFAPGKMGALRMAYGGELPSSPTGFSPTPAAAPAVAAPAPFVRDPARAASVGTGAFASTFQPMGVPQLKHGGALRTGHGGFVPGSGKGDKIDAKYEPGEFVVSNAMLDNSPGLREKLHAMRNKTLEKSGITPAQAEASRFKGGAIRAKLGFDPLVDQTPKSGGSFPAPAPDGVPQPPALTATAGSMPFQSGTAAMFRDTRSADKSITGVTGVPNAAPVPKTSQSGGATGAWDAPQPRGMMTPPATEPATTSTPALPAATTAPTATTAASGPASAQRSPNVTVTRQANGNLGFSGKDVSGDVSYKGDAAGALPGLRNPGSTFSVMPAMNQGAIAQTLSNPDGSKWSASDNAIMAANLRDGVDQYRGTSRGATPSISMREHLARMGEETQRQGQQLTASSAKYTADAHVKSQQAANGIAQSKLQIEQAKEARISQLDDLIINGNPLQKKMAAGQKAALMGKGQDSFADGKPLNDTQAKALLFGSRMQASGDILDSLAASGVNQPGITKRIADTMRMGTAANFTQSESQQQVEQAQRDFVNATLRRESGAAISESEFDNARKQYFPQPGDEPKQIEQKRQARLLSTRGILAEVPDSDARVAQIRGTPQQPASPAENQAPVHLSELQRRAAANPALAQRLKEAGY